MIRVKIIAPFDMKGVLPDDSVEMPPGTNIKQLLVQVGAPIFAHTLPLLVNGMTQKKTYRLQDGDLVVFILPLFGG